MFVKLLNELLGEEKVLFIEVTKEDEEVIKKLKL